MPAPAEAPTANRSSEATRSEVRSQSVQPRELSLIEGRKEELIGYFRTHNTVVLKAGTGTGKSTTGPLILLEALQRENPGKKVKILVAEPRQMLAEGISDHVAKTNGVPLGGDLIGFYHGDDHKYSDQTQIVYTVNGSLRKRIEEDKALSKYDAVCLDEIHLRDRDQEAILIGLKEVQKERKKRGLKPFKILITSANAEQKQADYYDNGVMMEIEGQKPRYDVKEHFLDKAPDVENIPIEMARLAAKVIKEKRRPGHLLGFLPGRREIQIAQKEFDRIMREEGLADKYKSASLTGGGGEENKALQKKLQDDDPNINPIMAFATDVADAGATFAISDAFDGGLIRTMVYDKESGLESLQTRHHAVSQYIQRKGRLGRISDGDFYAMYSEEELNNPGIHPKDAPPSILMEDLTPLVLSLKAMGITDVYAVDYMDHPGKEKLDMAVGTLNVLGALKPDGTLTDEGKAMVELPLDSHLARILVEVKKRGCVEAASVLVAFLNSNRSVFAYNPRSEQFDKKYARYIYTEPNKPPDSDYLTLLKVWNEYNHPELREENERQMSGEDWALKHGFSISVLKDVNTTKNEILQEDFFKGAFGGGLGNLEIDIAGQADAIKACIVAGFADKILLRDGDTYALGNGKRPGIQIDQKSVFAQRRPGMLISGAIRVQEGGRAFASMNWEVTKEFVKGVAPYLEEMGLVEKEQEVPKTAAEQVKNELQTEAAKASKSSVPAESESKEQKAEKKLSIIGKIKQAFKTFFDRIKAFWGL
ncbi:MAG: DEAD/DEAH box helicase [Candidatus Levyibacteriota bacterium]|nr:MAG: DEAD/DEAH box helicase [Candidatus Levybacteria bacterium]